MARQLTMARSKLRSKCLGLSKGMLRAVAGIKTNLKVNGKAAAASGSTAAEASGRQAAEANGKVAVSKAAASKAAALNGNKVKNTMVTKLLPTMLAANRSIRHAAIAIVSIAIMSHVAITLHVANKYHSTTTENAAAMYRKTIA
jgi:hypothetical protein